MKVDSDLEVDSRTALSSNFTSRGGVFNAPDNAGNPTSADLDAPATPLVNSGWSSDYVTCMAMRMNSLEMKVRSPEKFMDACDEE